MKKVFGMLMLLFLFVGISGATNGQATTTTNGISTEFVLVSADYIVFDKVDADVLTFTSQWLSDNYSSESDEPDAGMLDMISVNNKTKVIHFYTTKEYDFNIDYIYIGHKLTMKILYKDKDKPSDATNKKAKEITTKFRTDFYNWIYKME